MQICPHWPLENVFNYEVLPKKTKKEEETGHELVYAYDIKK